MLLLNKEFLLPSSLQRYTTVSYLSERRTLRSDLFGFTQLHHVLNCLFGLLCSEVKGQTRSSRKVLVCRRRVPHGAAQQTETLDTGTHEWLVIQERDVRRVIRQTLETLCLREGFYLPLT